jgi:ABC-2 type transport system ATP-binding protein
MSVGEPSDRPFKEAREAGVPPVGRTVGPTLRNVTAADQQITFENVSRFYGQVLGVNRINLSIPPGITSLVGPNGSGKTTLMNLMTGLVRPTEGKIKILGIPPTDPRRLFRVLGYSTQFDSFPRGVTGWQFIYSFLRLFGYTPKECEILTSKVIQRVGLTDAAQRRVAGYSKGMRQRIKLAQAIAHDPRVLVLDEPLNGLDPLVRAETIALFRQFAGEGRHVLVSSHVLHEVDLISDQFILLSNGYVVAEGQIQDVRSEIHERPMQVTIRCQQANTLASKVFELDHVVEARLHADGGGLLVLTRDADRFYRTLNHIALGDIDIESIAPADSNVDSVYEYLIGGDSQK